MNLKEDDTVSAIALVAESTQEIVEGAGEVQPPETT
jgi:hypothetical protein